MGFEWSEAKRIAVLEARGLDFIDAEILFDGRPLYTVPSPRGAEERWLSVGELNGRRSAGRRRLDAAERDRSNHHDEESPQ
jgi:uncharacterized DUF497 family protein